MHTISIGSFSATYDPLTGDFISTNIRGLGKKVGWERNGYIFICVNQKQIRAHHLAWRCMFGKFPIGDIDHINGNRSDNRISNLREVSRSVNMQNLKCAHKDNKSGLIGVSCLKNKYWFSRISVNGKTKHLGYFNSPEEAYDAYLTAKRKFHIGCTI